MLTINDSNASLILQDTSKQKQNSVIVVGVGASAGGIEAITSLLESTPLDTDLAFVIIMHLDPVHSSQLAEVLSRTTKMPVHEAAEGARLEPNQVYVIAPNTMLAVNAGHLHVTPRLQISGPNLPVDQFFNSLAEEFGTRSIGIVLSGTGSDGTLGLMSIKGSNGITFAQDHSAQHDGMPRSAIESSCVDFVLDPPGIAKELIRISKHAYVMGQPEDSSKPIAETTVSIESPYTELFRLLRGATQVDYANYKSSTIERRIQRRMLVHHLDKIEEYVTFVREHPPEVLALHRDLLIHVTRFFRDPQVFEAVKKVVFPGLNLDRPPDSPIRIWIAGCSSGEEVYSIAISLLEYLGDAANHTPIKIFATDVSDETLAQARQGIYLENIIADVSTERLRRFFVRAGKGYQIVKSIRDLCVFARHDMSRDPPFSSMDLISCRNVLIYLGPVLQQRILPLFHYALKPGKFLLLGNSETIGNLTDLYDIRDSNNRIYSTKSVPSRISFDFTSGGTQLSESPGVPNVTRDTKGFNDLKGEADRTLLNHYTPPGVITDENLEILQFRGQTGDFLTPAPGTASLNLLKMAKEGLLVELRAGIEEVRATNQSARREGITLRTNSQLIKLSIQFIPIRFSAKRCFAVLFERVQAKDTPDSQALNPKIDSQAILQASEHERQVIQLQQELEATKEFLQSSVEELESSNEELKAANEEIVSSNEELQSTNEELQTAKEELQASNEELQTVNEELLHRNREATVLGNDLSNLLRSVSIPIIMVGHDLRIRQFTPSAAELFKLIATDVGCPIAYLNPRLADIQLDQLISRFLTDLVVIEQEVLDSAGCWFRLSIRPYRTMENRIDGVVLSVIDIDLVKKSERQLEAARDYAEAILGTVHIPLAILDHDLRLISVNAAFREFFEVTMAETQKRFLTDLGNRQWNIPTLSQLLAETLATDQTLSNFIVHHDFPTIGPKVMLLNARRFGGTHGEPTTILLAIEDITERERAVAILREEQSRESQKLEAIGRLAGGIAHDFNNLLTIVNGYCEALISHLIDDQESIVMLTAIQEAGTRAANLTHQILAYGRKQILQPRDTNLNRIIVKMELMLRRILGENINIQVRLPSEPTRVMIDPNQMEQVIMNLCINARDAMPDGGDLILEASHVDIKEGDPKFDPEIGTGRFVRFVTRDTGTGMDEKTLSHIFEPFFTTKQVGAGTGLGLATVFGIVKQSGGQIKANSKLNKGTSFSIYLPAITNPTAELPAPNLPNQLSKENKTILIVEDEEAIRSLEMLALKSTGYHLLQAKNGNEAIQLCSKYDEKIDLLVTDVVMPGMSGHQLAEALIALRPKMKVLYLSGHLEETILRQGVQLKPIAFLAKPFSPAEFVNKVSMLLSLDANEFGENKLNVESK
jgi:two-component system, chemotaxis family, CheB/CheR fusion protein